MSASHFLEDGDRAQSWSRPQHRHDLAFPYRCQRIGPTSAALDVLLRGKTGIVFKTVAARGAKRSFRRRLRRRIRLTEFHVNPHLAVGDVSTWQGPDSSLA